MSKKSLTALVLSCSLGGLLIFAYFDAKAFQHSPTLVEQARENCENKKQYTRKQDAEINENLADIAGQFTEIEPGDDLWESLTEERKELETYRSQIKAEETKACGADIQAAIEVQAKSDRDYSKRLIQSCDTQKKYYKKNIKSIKAKGLSAQYSPQEIAQMIQNVKKEQKEICAFAKKAREALKNRK